MRLRLLIVLTILGLTFFPIEVFRSKAEESQSRETLARRQQLLEGKLAQDRRQRDLDRKIADFKRTKGLLMKRGVPFDPDTLMTFQWRKTLATHFSEMPELQEIKIGPGKLKGVHLAHTLYLPEKVELLGDTVILVRNLVFEGRNAIIKGNFSVAVYPIARVGLLGLTLDQALQRSGVRFIHVGFSGATARNLPANLPLMKGGSLTVDTSGFGYKEWREQQALKTSGRGAFVQAGLFSEDPIKNGASGKPGDSALPGADGAPVGVGVRGTDGTCGSTTSVNGSIGGNGPNGNPGLPPVKNGDNGGDGEPGWSCHV